MSERHLLGEELIWSGRPVEVRTPVTFRIAAVVAFILSGVSLSFAVVVSQALAAAPTQSVLFSFWSAAMGFAALEVPKLWLREVRYHVTRSYVVLERGPFRRTIERRSISFARIEWSRVTPGVGDIDLVRAVPAGALRRRLLLQLRGVAAPDQVWAIVRDARVPSQPVFGHRPLSQRLDDGEKVLWSATPSPSPWSYVPQRKRELGVFLLGLVLLVTFGMMIRRIVPTYRMLEASGLPHASVANFALLLGEGLAMGFVLALALWFLYDALVLPTRKLAATRYLITNRRVLIQRGREELHLDRGKVVDVIPSRSRRGLSDLFLVLDGPRARALAISGAFGDAEPGPQLHPVLQSVVDAEGVSRLLLDATEQRAA